MDAILHKAKRAQGGSSNALKKLNLDILEDPKLLARSKKKKNNGNSDTNSVREGYKSALRSSPVQLKHP